MATEAPDDRLDRGHEHGHAHLAGRAWRRTHRRCASRAGRATTEGAAGLWLNRRSPGLPTIASPWNVPRAAVLRSMPVAKRSRRGAFLGDPAGEDGRLRPSRASIRIADKLAASF